MRVPRLNRHCPNSGNTALVTRHLTSDCAMPPTEVALEREVEGDLFLADIGQGVPFRAGAFDGAISSVCLTSDQTVFSLD